MKHKMSNRRPIGAYVIHLYYPGALGLPENTSYIFHQSKRLVLFHFVRVFRPLEVTDFANRLYNKREGKRIYSLIEKPIEQIASNCAAVDATHRTGYSGPMIAIENGVNGRVFRNRVFTEIRVCTEYYKPDENMLPTCMDAMNRVIDTYKFVSMDEQVKSFESLEKKYPNIRSIRINYSKDYKKQSAEERLASLPLNFDYRLEMGSWKEAESGIASSSVKLENYNHVAEQLGAYIHLNFSTPELIKSLQHVFDDLWQNERYRVAAIEAMCIFEISIMRFWHEHASHFNKAPDPDGDYGYKELIEKILPQALRLYEGISNIGEIIKLMKEAREVRNEIMHKGLKPSAKQSLDTINAVNRVLTVLELEDRWCDHKFRPLKNKSS